MPVDIYLSIHIDTKPADSMWSARPRDGGGICFFSASRGRRTSGPAVRAGPVSGVSLNGSAPSAGAATTFATLAVASRAGFSARRGGTVYWVRGLRPSLAAPLVVVCMQSLVCCALATVADSKTSHHHSKFISTAPSLAPRKAGGGKETKKTKPKTKRSPEKNNSRNVESGKKTPSPVEHFALDRCTGPKTVVTTPSPSAQHHLSCPAKQGGK